MSNDNLGLYSLCLKAKYIKDNTVITKLTGKKEYTLKRKVLMYNSCHGDKKSIPIDLPDEIQNGVFLFSDHITIVNEDTILKIDTDDLYKLKNILEEIDERENLSLILPLHHIQTGNFIRKTNGDIVYEVKRENKVSIKIEEKTYPLYNTKDCVFLVNNGKAYLANEYDSVKIEGSVSVILDVIENIIMEQENK